MIHVAVKALVPIRISVIREFYSGSGTLVLLSEPNHSGSERHAGITNFTRNLPASIVWKD